MNCNNCCYNLPKDGHSYCTYEEGECVKISVLEKENAELKARLNAINLLTPELEKQSKVKKQRLTKAEKLIRSLLYVYQLGKNELAIARIRAEAEQFLKGDD